MVHRQLKPGLLALSLCVCAVLTACGASTHHPTHRRPPRGATQPSTEFRFFSPQSFWNAPLPTSTPVDPGSTRMVGALNAEVRTELRAKSGPWIDNSNDGVPVVTVQGNQPTVPVNLNHPGGTDPAIASAWRAVPLPANVRPSPGEHDLAVWQPSTDRMWEFWELTRAHGRWEARWGGAMQHVSSNPGVYGSQAWPGAHSWWGVTAASLPLVGGAMLLNQLESGHINHALALAIPNTRAGVYAAPAQRGDGTTASPTAIPEGARLRIDPRLNLASLRMPPLTRAIAQAAQRYGIIIRDTSGVVTFYAQDAPGASATYNKLYGGLYPSQLLASFPWSHLQVVKMVLHHAA